MSEHFKDYLKKHKWTEGAKAVRLAPIDVGASEYSFLLYLQYKKMHKQYRLMMSCIKGLK